MLLLIFAVLIVQNVPLNLILQISQQKNDFKEGFKEGLAQKQFDKDAEIMQLKQQLKKFQSIKEYRVNKLLVKNKKLKQQLALTEKALEERGKELLTFANRISEQNKEIFDLRSRLISKTLKGE